MTAATGRKYRHPHRWYVDGALATGSANGTSWANAWKTLGAISWAGIGAGDVIYISGGSTSQSYTGAGSTTLLTVGASGSSGRPITITKGIETGHNGEVVLDGQNGGRDGIDVFGFSWVTIQNLTLQNAGGGHENIYVRGNPSAMSGVIVQNCKVHVGGTNNNSHQIGICYQDITGGSGNAIRWNFCDTADSGGPDGASFTDQTDILYLQSNSGDDCLAVYGNTLIQKNSNTNGHNDCIQIESGVSQVQNGNLSIYGNYFEILYNGDNLHAIFADTPADGKVFSIYNNVIRLNGSSNVGIYPINQVNLNTSTNGIHKIYNNTFHQIASALVTTASAMIYFDNTNVATEIKNNIFYSDGANNHIFNGTYSPTSVSQVNNNVHFLANGATYGASAGWDANGQTGNPNFVSAAAYPSGDYHITTGSSAINNGATLGAVPIDRDGKSRPQGSAYCIGAYEFP